MRWLLAGSIVTGILALAGGVERHIAAADAPFPPVHLDLEQRFVRNISEYNLFLDNQRQEPNTGLVPYDLTTPLFTDYAHKHRFVYLPPGASAVYDPRDPFDFPVGTILIKTFSYLRDIRDPAQGEDIVETRLLIHKEEGWIGLPYIWDEDMREARLAVAGGNRDVEWIHFDGERRRINYLIPNMNQCKQCHEIGGRLQPIGPAARFLNKTFDYSDGPENQLARWQRIGYLEGAPENPEEAPRAPVWDDPATGGVAERARAWLDINCAHCHNPDGPGHTSGLDLRMWVEEAARYGVMKPPVAAGQGSGGLRFGIVPGDPDASILVHRIESTEPGVMMPTTPHRLAHTEGAALIREWIAGMPPPE